MKREKLERPCSPSVALDRLKTAISASRRLESRLDGTSKVGTTAFLAELVEVGSYLEEVGGMIRRLGIYAQRRQAMGEHVRNARRRAPEDER